MSEQVTEVSFEASGSHAAETVKNILESHGDNIEQISVEFTVSRGEESGKKTATQKRPVSMKNNDANDREEGHIRSGTNHHIVLKEISEIGGDDPVSAADLNEAIEGVAEGSIYAALSKLWKRKLLNRERSGDDRDHYVYWLSDHGKKELKRANSAME